MWKPTDLVTNWPSNEFITVNKMFCTWSIIRDSDSFSIINFFGEIHLRWTFFGENGLSAKMDFRRKWKLPVYQSPLNKHEQVVYSRDGMKAMHVYTIDWLERTQRILRGESDVKRTYRCLWTTYSLTVYAFTHILSWHVRKSTKKNKTTSSSMSRSKGKELLLFSYNSTEDRLLSKVSTNLQPKIFI